MYTPGSSGNARRCAVRSPPAARESSELGSIVLTPSRLGIPSRADAGAGWRLRWATPARYVVPLMRAGNLGMGFALGLIAATVACACVLAADSAQARPIYIDAPNPGGRERAVVPVPPPGNRLFGVHDNFIISHGPGEWTPEQVAEIAAGAGAEIFRFTIDWQLVEPQRDEWDPAEWQRV